MRTTDCAPRKVVSSVDREIYSKTWLIVAMKNATYPVRRKLRRPASTLTSKSWHFDYAVPIGNLSPYPYLE